MRRDLPNKRKSIIQKVSIQEASGNWQTFYLTIGFYEDGSPGEVFIDASKEGTFTRGILSALARMVSIALQNDVALSEVVKTLRHLNFPPKGEVKGSEKVSKCASVVDWIAQELSCYIKSDNLIESKEDTLILDTQPCSPVLNGETYKLTHLNSFFIPQEQESIETKPLWTRDDFKVEYPPGVIEHRNISISFSLESRPGINETDK